MGPEGRGTGRPRGHSPPGSQPHPLAGLHLNMRFRPVSPRVSASCGPLPALGAVGDSPGNASGGRADVLSPRRSLAPSLQIGLCGLSTFCPPSLSQLPKATAQILPSALEGTGPTQRGDRPREPSANGGPGSVRKRERVFQVLAVGVEVTSHTWHFAPRPLQG